MTTGVLHTHTPQLNREFVLAKCDYFVDVQLWPLQKDLNPKRWLENFTTNELPYALRLLESFYFFSEPLTNELLYGAFQALSRRITSNAGSLYLARHAWRSFVDRAIFTFPTGERPNATDSGHFFARKARQVLSIDQERIVGPQEALSRIHADPTIPVVFVDDFVGTGSQFVTTWRRLVTITQSATPTSFQQYVTRRGGHFYYVPLICTEVGYSQIQTACPEVVLSPAHLLSAKYSAVADDSFIWPQEEIQNGIAFLREVSSRAGMPDTDGASEHDWQGFRKLGLTLAFSHSVPDATLPIFYWEHFGWKPLIRRV